MRGLNTSAQSIYSWPTEKNGGGHIQINHVITGGKQTNLNQERKELHRCAGI